VTATHGNVGKYLQTWKLTFSTTKTVPAAFHLHNEEAKGEIKVNYKNEILPFCPEPQYLFQSLFQTPTPKLFNPDPAIFQI